MNETRLLMGMPITVEVADSAVTQTTLDAVFANFLSVDETFSTYKDTSEVAKLNRGELSPHQLSRELRTILALSEQTKRETHGYFNIWRDGRCDPSGLVKGWAIRNASHLLAHAGWRDYYIHNSSPRLPSSSSPRSC